MELLAGQLDAAADVMTTVDRRVPAPATPAAFAGDEPIGLPGRLGAELHAHWSAVLAARAHEASDAAARLSELAVSARAAGRAYLDTDAAAADRVRRSPGGDFRGLA
jgi:hypothetical protein